MAQRSTTTTKRFVPRAVLQKEFYYYDAEFERNLRTGDLILFSGQGVIAEGIELATGSEWTHVGMVWRNDYDVSPLMKPGGLYLAESVLGIDEAVDVLTGKPKEDIRLVDLHARIVAYQERKLSVRQLLFNHRAIGCRVRGEFDLNKRLFEAIEFAHKNFVYDQQPLHFIDAIDSNLFNHPGHKLLRLLHEESKVVGSSSGDRERFCSAFVAYCYRSAGVLNPTPNAESVARLDHDFFPVHWTSQYDGASDYREFTPGFSFYPTTPTVIEHRGHVVYE